MARSTRKDSVELPSRPLVAIDRARQAARLAEFRRRLAYIDQHYRMGRHAYGIQTDLNDVIRKLKAAATGRLSSGDTYRRLPPMLETIVSLHARRFARERTGHEGTNIECEDVAKAVDHVANCLSPIGHRPPDHNLIHHVEGLIALIQEFSGLSVIPRRNLNSDYNPHFAPGVSQIVPMIFKQLEPSVTIGRLVSIGEAARRKWAGRKPTFREYFPGYGLQPGPDGSLCTQSGELFATFTPNVPTYFH